MTVEAIYLNNNEKKLNSAYDVTITDGTGTVDLPDGEFSASATVDGYDSTTLSPLSVTVTAGVTVYDFTIGATGTLTLHVSETGESTGTPVEGAVFYRCDEDGTTYGDPVTTSATGVASLANVPWSATDAPTVYYKQTATAEGHAFDDSVQEVTLTAQTTTVEVTNAPLVTRTINLTDANYTGLAIESGSMTLTDE